MLPGRDEARGHLYSAGPAHPARTIGVRPHFARLLARLPRSLPVASNLQSIVSSHAESDSTLQRNLLTRRCPMGDKYDAKDTMVTSSFNDREAAERAYESIVQRGYNKDDVAVLMTEDTHKKYFPKGDKSDMGERGDHALKGAAIGGGLGGAVGATALGIAAATAAIAIPGIGLMVAGPLAGALTGGAIGATSGGIIGL